MDVGYEGSASRTGAAEVGAGEKVGGGREKGGKFCWLTKVCGLA